MEEDVIWGSLQWGMKVQGGDNEGLETHQVALPHCAESIDLVNDDQPHCVSWRQAERRELYGELLAHQRHELLHGLCGDEHWKTIPGPGSYQPPPRGRAGNTLLQGPYGQQQAPTQLKCPSLSRRTRGAGIARSPSHLFPLHACKCASRGAAMPVWASIHGVSMQYITVLCISYGT